MGTIKDRCAIVGIGETEYSRNSGRSELALAVEAIKKAVDDAGLSIRDVDGLAKYSIDTSGSHDAVATALGIPDLRYSGEVGGGGSAGAAVVGHAAAAILAGLASTVVCYRAMNGRSGRRFGDPAEGRPFGPWGWMTPGQDLAMSCRRYMHEYGVTSSQLGAVAVACRKHANLNPRAQMHGIPLDLDDHQASRYVAEPLHLFDFCLETDGACAVVVTSSERARGLRRKPAYVMAVAQGSGPAPQNWSNRSDMWQSPQRYLAPALFKEAGIGAKDVDAAQMYDCFTFTVLIGLEAFGFCGEGEAGDFVQDGRIELGGELPVNTHGGLLSEGYIHGFNHIVEGVRQVRGVSTGQVPDADVVLVTSGGVPGVVPSAMLLRG